MKNLFSSLFVLALIAFGSSSLMAQSMQINGVPQEEGNETIVLSSGDWMAEVSANQDRQYVISGDDAQNLKGIMRGGATVAVHNSDKQELGVLAQSGRTALKVVAAGGSNQNDAGAGGKDKRSPYKKRR